MTAVLAAALAALAVLAWRTRRAAVRAEAAAREALAHAANTDRAVTETLRRLYAAETPTVDGHTRWLRAVNGQGPAR